MANTEATTTQDEPQIDRVLDGRMAEFMGWKRVKKYSRKEYDAYRTADGFLVYIGDHPEPEEYECDHPEDQLWSPSTQLTAAYEVEERLKELLIEDIYVEKLWEEVYGRSVKACLGTGGEVVMANRGFRIIHASPLDRCRAAIAAAGGAKEST